MARYTGPKSKIARKFKEPIFGPDKALEKKNYPADLIDQACGEAYRIGRFSSRYVEKIILDLLKQKHLNEKLENNKPAPTKYTSQGGEYSRHVESLMNKKIDPTTIH